MPPRERAARGRDVPLPPQNLEAEEHVLGAMMLSTVAIEAVTAIIQPTDFWRDSHRRIYETILELYAAGSSVDAITVAGRLEASGLLEEVGGKDRIREIATLVPAATSSAHYARLIREVAGRRGLINAGTRIAQLGQEPEGETVEMLSEAERLVFELSQTLGRNRGDLTHARVIANETYEMMMALAASDQRYVGLPLGFRALDRLTSGLRPSNLIIIAGRPSMGKTALALCAAANIVLRESPTPVAIFSLEMNRTELMQRLVSSEAMVDSTRVQNPARLTAEDHKAVAGAFSRLSMAPLWVDDTGATTLTEIRSKVRRMKLREPELGLLVVDYIQLMASGIKADNRNAELSLISRSLKLLAVELGIPILIISQLSRDVEDRHDKRPILSDLRDSGALEQDADVVMMVYREEYYYPEDADANGTAGLAEVNILKQRNGPVGMRKLAFRSPFAKFTDLHETEGGEP